MLELGTLYIVSTPIGNLEDITLRALRILREVDVVAAEDTRHTRKLLSHYKISTPLTSYFEHNKFRKGSYLLKKLKEGKDIALVSDAGTPGISDPGYHLIQLARKNSIRTVPIPGSSAVIAALSVSGLPTDSFVFEGFLPAPRGKRKRYLEALKDERRTVVLYESPRRLLATLEDIKSVFGSRDIVVGRELTKIHEDVLRGTVDEVIGELKGKKIKGEITLIVAGRKDSRACREPLREELKIHLKESGLPLKEIVGLVAKRRGIPRKEVYQESLKLKGTK
ncbi:MAG: 16S rRNA (cytidine(1402)-2'-O)-methyltransferase [Deltaproteobacteria bacterium]|nr:MAG: 16S rRNA (cytidine(1402)-2'-O)-methyltransferase [Deltaproteobacteria bacterium]